MPDVTDQFPLDVREERDAFLGTVALALVGYAKDRFEPENNVWPATAWPRVAELVDDLQDGIVRERTLEQSHQTGVGTGRLRDSIHAKSVGGTLMLAIGGAEVDYAERFHRGGSNTLPIPQRELRRWYHTKAGKAFIKEHQLGWLFAMEALTVKSEPRPLVTAGAVRGIIADELRERYPNAEVYP